MRRWEMRAIVGHLGRGDHVEAQGQVWRVVRRDGDTLHVVSTVSRQVGTMSVAALKKTATHMRWGRVS